MIALKSTAISREPQPATVYNPIPFSDCVETLILGSIVNLYLNQIISISSHSMALLGAGSIQRGAQEPIPLPSGMGIITTRTQERIPSP